MKRNKKRQGFTIIELLVVVAIVVVLAAIAFGMATASQDKARRYRAQAELQSYSDAFTSALASYPGTVNERGVAWTGADSYSSAAGLKGLVKNMNVFLSDDLDVVWDSELKCYKSSGTDPWGDPYILTEYPILTGTEDFYDPTAPGNASRACISVWSLGGQDISVLSEPLTKKTLGLGIMHFDGITSVKWNGLNDEVAFQDYSLRLQ